MIRILTLMLFTVLVVSCGRVKETYIKVNTGVLLEGSTAVYYNLALTPTTIGGEESVYLKPSDINEAHEELDKMLPEPIQLAFAQTIRGVKSDASGARLYDVYWSSFEKKSCIYLKNKINYPCYFVLDLERFLKDIWSFDDNSLFFKKYNNDLLVSDDVLYSVIITYAMKKAGVKVNFKQFLSAVSKFSH
ncbi:hypothetical protein [Pseudidiomarina donghaiensis]|uniref:Lipoprotein n=1 Tax=Pseudidiomarina donghaiensis TaxID=519452 RepID=A0A432XBS9_9GAMM|nr:hypothetical protein [Pseudidiomarina donghaiensis]RUO46209.1 hypothetical protein CWE24_11575 [Pseudidiomarina donghaiensis]SFV24808.1 hypothetical protein SAMN04488139_2466 [Pseudidiomarina donghaiensis]